ncbi:MAG TPA: hypothetical protein VNO31_40240, partial [Umezawaea sp.]|nr:hypothetical protein [Umezawaea sp.]
MVYIDDSTTSNAVHGRADTVFQTGSIDSVSVTSHPARPGWWLGAALVTTRAAAAALVVTAVEGGTDVTGRAVPAVLFPTEVPTERAKSPEESIHVDSVRYVAVPRVGSTFAFPDGVDVSGQVDELSDLATSELDDYRSRARELGGVAPHDVAVQISLRGVSRETAVITDMRALATCGEPLTGTLLYSPPAGEDIAPQIGFDLDRPSAPAQSYQSGDLSGSYFLDRTVSVEPGETQVLVVHGLTAKRHCEFRIEMTVNAGVGVTGVEQVVDDGGKPFEVTALDDFPAYGRVYAGGVVSPSQDGRFV